MIIISQNKENIINFEKVNIINIYQLNKKQIGAWFSCNEEENNNVLLGEYATEERAKEVLQEIIKTYIESKEVQEATSMFGFSILPSNTYYEMPKE